MKKLSSPAFFKPIIFSVICGDVKLFEKTFLSLKIDYQNPKYFNFIINFPNLSDVNGAKWKTIKDFKKVMLQKKFFQILESKDDNLFLRKDFFNQLF